MRTEATLRTRSALVLVTMLAPPLLLGACGNLTAGGFGDVTVVVSGDAEAPAASLHPTGLAGAAPMLQSGEELEGEIEAEFDLFLVSQSGIPVQLGPNDIRVRVDVRGRAEADAVRQEVAADRYTELRIVFSEIEVEVDAGLIIDGVPVTGPIDVRIEGTFVIERPVVVEIEDGSAIEFVVDLSTPAWLQAVDPATNTVDPSALAGLIGVLVRPGT